MSAVELIIKYGFDELGLERIYAGVFDFNHGSIRVLEKVGFRKWIRRRYDYRTSFFIIAFGANVWSSISDDEEKSESLGV